MEFILNIIKYLLYVHDKVFWLKELLTTVQSIIVFLLAWKYLHSDHLDELIFLMTFVCFVGIFVLPVGYWSDNDTFKFVLPSCLLLHIYNKKGTYDFILFAILFLYIYSSYEYFRGFYAILQSLATHFVIVVCIVVAKENIITTIFISTIIGILINYIGYYGPSGTNDFLVNSGIISFAVKGIAVYTKNSKYDAFLKLFWIILLCFAYFGSWIFYFIESAIPVYLY